MEKFQTCHFREADYCVLLTIEFGYGAVYMGKEKFNPIKQTE